MEKPGSVLEQGWHDSLEGKELFGSILVKNRRRIFGAYRNNRCICKILLTHYHTYYIKYTSLHGATALSQSKHRELPNGV